MAFPKLTKQEALRLECVRVSRDEIMARVLYDFIVEKPEPKKTIKKPTGKKCIKLISQI